jgi:hypothetical protein
VLGHLGYGVVQGSGTFFFYCTGNNLPNDEAQYNIAITKPDGVTAVAGFSAFVVGFPDPGHTIIRVDYQPPQGGLQLQDLGELSITITVTVSGVKAPPLTVTPALDVSALIDPNMNPPLPLL